MKKEKWTASEICLITAGILIALFLWAAPKAMGSTLNAQIFHDSNAGDSGSVWVISALSGNILDSATLSEDATRQGAWWTASLTVEDPGPLFIWGYVLEGSEPYFTSYEVDVTSDWILDTVQSQSSWAAKEASLFDPSTDSVLVDVSAAGEAGGLASTIEDTIYAHTDDYKATGFSTFDASAESVFVDVSAASDDGGLLSIMADTLTDYAFVADDTVKSGDSIGIFGSTTMLSWKQWKVTNQAGDAVVFTGGLGGGEPVTGDGFKVQSNYGDGFQATSSANGYDINADIQGDLSGDVGGVGNAGIATASFAAGAINATALATDCITADKIEADAIGASEVNSDLSGTTGEIATGVWGYNVLGSASRGLTYFDEDNMSIDLDATTFGTVATVTNAVTISDASIADIEDTIYYNRADYGATVANVWAYDTSSATSGIGLMLKDTAAYQGSASGLSAASIMDSLFNRLVSDTATGTFMADLIRYCALSGDTSLWANITDVWQNVDTAGTVDTSEIGAWFESWIAHQSTADSGYNQATSAYNEIVAARETLALYDTRLDSILDGVSDVSIGDKVWIDAGTRTLSSYIWSADYRDSVLGALSDIAKPFYKATGFSTFDASAESVFVDVSAAGEAGGLASMIEDTINANASDYKATGFSSHTAADVWSSVARTLTELDEDNTTIDIDDLTIGAVTSVTNDVGITDADMAAIEDTIHAHAADYMADVASLSTFDPASDSVIVDVSAAIADSGLGHKIADKVLDEDTADHYTPGQFAYEASQTAATALTAAAIWAYDTSNATSGIGLMLKDTSAYQGSASGLSAATIWAYDTSNATSGIGLMLKDTSAYQGSSAGGGSDTAAIRAMMEDEGFTPTSIAETTYTKFTDGSNADAFKADAGSDTTAIRTMMEDEGFTPTSIAETTYTKFTDGTNANNFKATGFSTHSAGDVYQYFTNSTNEDAFKATGFSTHSPTDVSDATWAKFNDGSNENNFKADVSGISTHSELDVYNAFISGTNEQAFWIPDSVREQIAGLARDSVGSVTASVDKDSVRDAVWQALSSSYTTDGTFGKYLDMQISSVTGLSGAGAYTVNILVLDTGATTDSVIPQVNVYVNNQAQSATPYLAATNNNGIAIFNLDAGTYVKFITKAGFATVVDTFTISAASTDTLKVYRDAGDRTTVSWRINDIIGDPLTSARLKVELFSAGDSVLYIGDTLAFWPDIVEAIPNSGGVVSLNLIPNSDFTNDSTWYKATIRAEHGARRTITQLFRVPDTSAIMDFQYLTRWNED